MKAAKFPCHRDMAGFDFASSKVDRDLVGRLATLEFSDTAQNVVLIGEPTRFSRTEDAAAQLAEPSGRPGNQADAD